MIVCYVMFCSVLWTRQDIYYIPYSSASASPFFLFFFSFYPPATLIFQCRPFFPLPSQQHARVTAHTVTAKDATPGGPSYDKTVFLVKFSAEVMARERRMG